jgi:hypothetical protein
MVLTKEKVDYIRSSNKSLRAVAAELGCSKSAVNSVRNWGAWARLAGEAMKAKLRARDRLIGKQRKQIRELLAASWPWQPQKISNEMV